MTVKELLQSSIDGEERKKLSLICEEKQNVWMNLHLSAKLLPAQPPPFTKTRYTRN